MMQSDLMFNQKSTLISTNLVGVFMIRGIRQMIIGLSDKGLPEAVFIFLCQSRVRGTKFEEFIFLEWEEDMLYLFKPSTGVDSDD